MDSEKLIQLKHLIDNIIGDDPPTAEDLNYDNEAIEIYDVILRLQETMESYGF